MNYDGHIRAVPLDKIVLSDFAPSESGLVNFWVPRYRTIQTMSIAIKEVSGEQKPIVLDVNCGSGLVGRLLSDTGQDVIGIDSNANFIRQASEVYGNENTRFVRGDARNLPEIVSLQDISKVDGVYSSFMPKEVNFVKSIKKIQPKVIIYVFEIGERDKSRVKQVLNPSEGYEICAIGNAISYRDLPYLDSLHTDSLATGFVIQVRERAGEQDRLKCILQQLAQQDTLKQRYTWEVELDQKLAEIGKMAQQGEKLRKCL